MQNELDAFSSVLINQGFKHMPNIEETAVFEKTSKDGSVEFSVYLNHIINTYFSLEVKERIPQSKKYVKSTLIKSFKINEPADIDYLFSRDLSYVGIAQQGIF